MPHRILHHLAPMATSRQVDGQLMACFTQAQQRLHQAHPAQLDSAIDDALAMTGRECGADRAYVFQFVDHLFICNTHEWCAPGVRALKSELQWEYYSSGEVFWNAFRQHGAMLLHDIELVPVGTDLRLMLEDQNVRSLIAVPLWRGRQMAGFIGMDFCHAPRSFSVNDMLPLQGLAATLGLALSARDLNKGKMQAEADLHTANARVSAMIRALPELLIESDSTGVVTAFHQSAPMTLALRPDEVIGQPPEGFLPPYAAAISRKAMAQVNQNGWSETFVYPLRLGTEEKRFALHATAKGDARGTTSAKGYLFVVRDVTESHRQDRHIRQLGRVAELSTNLIFLTDADRRITWINPASTRSTGYSLPEAVGKRPSEILRLGEANPQVTSIICEKLDQGQDIHEDVQALSQSGMPYWVNLNVQKLCDADGRTEAYMVVGTDVTAHKLAESRALRERASAMDALHEGIAIVQPDGSFSYLNPALREFLNLPEEAPLETLFWQDISPDKFNRQLVGLLPELYAEGVWRGDITLPDAVAGERHFDVSVAVQEDGSFLFISRDTTARKRAEREQALLREQLQVAHSRQLVAQLASGLAHDVANVLAVISTGIETVKPVQRPEAARALERIEAAATQAQALVKNLSRLGRPSPVATVLDLRPLVEQAADLVRPSLGSRARIGLDLPAQPIEIVGESTSIMQVLLNLMLNARDALATDTSAGARIDIRLDGFRGPAELPEMQAGQLVAGKDYAVIEITDSGNGMSDDQKALMFEPYFSTKGQQGVGLGLSVVADILSMTMGAIQIDSALGHGTTVRVFWPIAAPAVDSAQSALESAAESAPLKGYNVLLVDDDDTVLMQMARALSAAGAEVASCIDPRDALAAVHACPTDWDIVVTDHDMGAMTGRDLAMRLHAISPNLPIILASGARSLQSPVKAEQDDFVFTLRKPVTEAVLVAVLLDVFLRQNHFSQAADRVDATIIGR